MRFNSLRSMEIAVHAAKIFDAIVVGTGAGGGTAMKLLCEAGSGLCAQFRPAHRSQQGLSPPPPGLRFEVSRLRQSAAVRGQGASGALLGRRVRIQRRPRSLRARHRLLQRSGHRLVLEAVQGHRRQGQFLGTLVGALRRHRLQGRGPRRLRRELAGRLRRDRAVVFEGRALHGRGQHGSEPAEQSRRRVSAADALALHRLHHPEGRREDRRAVSARSLRAADGGAQRSSRVPLLRQLQPRLRRRIVLFSHLVHDSRCRGDQESHAAHQCARAQRDGR